MAERNNVGGKKKRASPVDEPVAPPPAPDSALAGASAEAPLRALFEDFFVARKPLKGSPHTEAAYRSDLAAISACLAADLGTEPDELRLGQGRSPEGVSCVLSKTLRGLVRKGDPP
jgi:hypothetical protein